MVRVSAIWALFLLSLPAFAVDFGPPTRIPADPWTPPPFSYYQLTDPQAAASRNGYVAGWVDRAGLHYVRLDRQRQPLGPPQSLSPYSTTDLIGIVTDGASFGVAWQDGFATIDANGNVRSAKLNEYLRAIAPFGNRFIALSHDALYRWSVITLDIEGNVLERVPFEPVYRAEEFYEFGGRLWLVRDTDRVPLTDAAGKLSPGTPEPLPIPANERTLAARMVGSRLYLITGAPGARTIVRELDPVSAAPVRTVATLPDRNDFVLTGDARGQLLVAFLTYGTRTIRVHAIGEDGSVAAADIAAADVT